MSHGNFFGRLHEVNVLFGQIEPIAEVAGESWTQIEDRKKRFPRDGRVRVAPGLIGTTNSRGSFWFFACHQTGSGSDHWSADHPERAIPVLDMSDQSNADVRRLLLQEGIRLPDQQARQAVVLLAGGKYCRFKFEKHDAMWQGRLPTDGIVEIRPIDPNWSIYQHRDGFGYLPLDSDSTAVVERVDWTPTREFLSKVVERYRAAVEAYVGLGAKSSDDPVKRLHRALSEARVLGNQGYGNDALVHRLQEAWSATDQTFSELTEFGEFLLGSGAGKALLQRAVDAKTHALSVDIEAETRSVIEAHFEPRRIELEAIRQHIEVHRTEMARLESSVDALQRRNAESMVALTSNQAALAAKSRQIEEANQRLKDLEERRAVVDSGVSAAAAHEAALRESLGELDSELERFAGRVLEAAEMSNVGMDERTTEFANRIKHLLGSRSTAQGPLLTPTAAPWWSPDVDESRMVTVAELPGRLESEAAFHGVLAEDLRLLDAFLRSGELVVLLGSGAEASLTALARAAAGGRIRNQALDPSAIGLDDLWRVPGSHRPTPFAMAWHRATSEPGMTVLVCLRNLDTAPFRLWVRSLRTVLAASNRPANLLVAATVIGRAPNEEEFPDAVELRRHLVAIEPRFTDAAHKSDFALWAKPSQATTLTVDVRTGGSNVSRPPIQLLQPGRSPDTVARTLRLRTTLHETNADKVSLAWAEFLHDGRADGLPSSLRDGYDRLEDLHFQR